MYVNSIWKQHTIKSLAFCHSKVACFLLVVTNSSRGTIRPDNFYRNNMAEQKTQAELDAEKAAAEKKAAEEAAKNKGKVITNDDGTITVDGKTYVVKDSYDEVAKKARERKATIDKAEADKAAAEKKQLEEEGKYKELAEKQKAENERLQAQITSDRKTSALKTAALAAGAQNADTIAKLVDMEQIQVGEDGTVNAEAIKAAVDGLKESQPFLFAEGQQTQQPVGNGNGGAPQGGTGGGTQQFYRSQLQDSKFYQENRDEILAAERNGQIIDDIDGGGK